MVKRGFLWGLGIVVLLSVINYWWSKEWAASTTPGVNVVASVDKSQRTHSSNRDLQESMLVPEFSFDGSVRATLNDAKRDFFFEEQPTEQLDASASTEPALNSKPTPQLPALKYRYLGGTTNPEGKVQLYLTEGQRVVPVVVGEYLDGEFVVRAVRDEGVLLFYPPMDAYLLIPIPPAPQVQ